MKALKMISKIAAVIGFILIIGAAGTHDMLMEMEQLQKFDFTQAIIGAVMMLQYLVVRNA